MNTSSTVIERNKLGSNIQNSESDSAFWKQVFKVVRPGPIGTFNVDNPHGI